MSSNLVEILNRSGSDKASAHSYGLIYEPLFAKFRESAKAVLEIGVYRGASLCAWHEYFSNAVIVGFDCQPQKDCVVPSTRAVVAQVDATKENQIAAHVERYGPFDLIIDDGSHDPHEQRATCDILIKSLAPGGLYVVEDLRSIDIAHALAKVHNGVVFDLRAVKNLHDDILVVFWK